MHEGDPARRLDLYEAVSDSLQDSVFALDPDGTLSFANARFCEVTGRPYEELVGLHFAELGDLLDEETLSTLGEHLTAVATGVTNERRLQFTAVSPTVGEAVVEARITPVEADELSGAVVVLRDLTEQVETAAALEVKSEQLAVVNAVLRHDVRNDMNIVLGWADVLEQYVTDSEARETLDRIVRHGSHVVEITHAARDLVEAIEEDWEMELRPVWVGPTLTREVELVREQFPDAEVDHVDVDPDLAVRANEFLGSVVSNLLTNAVRHSDRDRPHVTVGVEASAGRVGLTVADDGPGIPDAQKEAVCELGTKGPDSPGTGLGLYLVQSLADAYGGSVTIADNEPRGTVVTVDLERVE